MHGSRLAEALTFTLTNTDHSLLVFVGLPAHPILSIHPSLHNTCTIPPARETRLVAMRLVHQSSTGPLPRNDFTLFSLS
ncbi:unnamed protein product [Protopolystoma xenopodis]|uniref:Uncharacterized protein n=1 Tax=Protopolystoma xenopodis TaxID=117903 RepID=A0A3S5B042_9PLAT|nr:unnamed protein product [Protopolystoma xenopodis]